MNRPPGKPTAMPQPPGAEAPRPAWHRYVAEIAACLRETLARTDAERLLIANSGMTILQGVPPDVVTAERIEALQSIAQIQYVSGNPLGGLEPAVEALSFARKLGDRLTLARSLNTVACTLGDTVDVAGAIEFYREALDLAVDLKHPRAECAIWSNLAMSLIYAAQYDESIRCSERAVHLCQTHVEAAPHLGAALGNIALACLHMGDSQRGLAAAKDAVDALSDPRDANDLLNRVLAETYYARLLLDVAQHEVAKIRCSLAKTYATRSGSPRAMLSASILEGLVEVSTGKADIGLSRLLKALEQSRVMRTAYRDALYALISAHKTLGHASSAEVYVRELMLQTRATQRDYLKGHTSAALHEAMRPTTEVSLDQAAHHLDDEKTPAWKRLERLAETAALRLDSTGEHPYRVGRLAGLMAQAHGCSLSECRAIELAARVHDVGMGALPEDLFGEKADAASFDAGRLRRHAEIGAELLDHIDLDLARFARDVVLHHHERYDGTGYPDGLSGSGIPFAARLVAVANAFDMLTHAGPKRGRKSIDRALDDLVENQSTKFDPHAVRLCVDVVTELRTTVADLDDHLAEPAATSPLVIARRGIQGMLAARGQGAQQQPGI
jgi:putative two-component system response regulator